jgi:hypothetical protein
MVAIHPVEMMQRMFQIPEKEKTVSKSSRDVDSKCGEQ